MGYEKTEAFVCDTCGLGTGPTDVVEADDEALAYPPKGWARVRIERVVLNPEYTEALAARTAQIDAQIDQIAQLRGVTEVTAADREQARAVLDLQVPPPDVEEFIVDEVIAVLCPEHVKGLLTLGVVLEGEVESKGVQS